MKDEGSRYGSLNYRSGFQRVMWHYSQYVKLWLRCNNSVTLTDLSKNGNHLTASGSPVAKMYPRLGRPAVDFDPTNSDYFSIAHASQTGLDFGVKDFVVLAIAKSSDKSQIQGIARKDTTKIYLFRIENTTGYIRAYVNDGATSQSVEGVTDVCDGKYHLFQYSGDRDSITGLKVHLDGSLDCTPTDLTSIGDLDSTGDFYFGSTGGSSEFFNGSIAELMMLVGNPTLPAWVLSDAFAAWVDNFSRKWPLEIPHEA